MASSNIDLGFLDGGGPTGGNGSGGSYSSGTNGKKFEVTLPWASNQSEYINQMYDNKSNAAQQGLKGAYDSNMLTLEQQQRTIEPTYQQTANQAAANAAIQNQNLNNALAANGTNTGAGSQARLAQNMNLQSNLNNINMQKAQALTDIENTRAKTQMEYQNAIQKAIADNDVERAQALYAEATRVDNSYVDVMNNQANIDYNVWAKMYKA